MDQVGLPRTYHALSVRTCGFDSLPQHHYQLCRIIFINDLDQTPEQKLSENMFLNSAVFHQSFPTKFSYINGSPMSFTDGEDYYAILGAARTASQAEIGRLYKRLAKQRHPDRGGYGVLCLTYRHPVRDAATPCHPAR